MTSLRTRMMEDMQVRNLSHHTQDVYLLQVSQFARHFAKSPDLLGPEDVHAYQVYLTNEKKLAPRSVQVTVAALRFLYRVTLGFDWDFERIIPCPKAPKTLAVILSPEEVLHFLGCIESFKHQAILTTCYAAGLRISEATRLKPQAIDRQRMVLRVEQGKGQKDRYVMLSARLLEVLTDYWRAVRPTGAWMFPGAEGSGICRTLYTPGGYRQQPDRRYRGWQGPLPVEGLSQREPAKGDDARRR